MQFLPEIQIRNNKYVLYSLYFGFAILLGLLQISLIPLIEIADSVPNLLLIFAVWITLREGKTIGFLYAFFFGIIYDIFTLQVIGVSSLSYLFGVLFASFFYRREKEMLVLASYRFILIVFVSVLISNLIENIFYLKLSEINFWTSFVFKWLGSTVYTAILSTIPFFVSFRNKIN
jgi:rod shape-determining protein MreD